MKRKRMMSSGSVLSYVIIGVILVAILGGVFYGLRQRAHQAAQEGATAVQEESNRQGDGVNTEVQPQSDAARDDAPVASENRPADVAQELPATGPVEFVSGVVALAALTFTCTAFVRSRRVLRQSVLPL